MPKHTYTKGAASPSCKVSVPASELADLARSTSASPLNSKSYPKIGKQLHSYDNIRNEFKDVVSKRVQGASPTIGDAKDPQLAEEEPLNDKENLHSSIASKEESKQGSATKEIKAIRDRPSSCVFVASLTSSLSDDQLCIAVTNYFSTWGVLTGVKVLRDPHNRPYAFVQYSNDKDAKNAICHAHNSDLEGRPIRCERAKVNRTLFFSSSLAYHENDIRSQLEVFGEVEKALPSNDKGYILLNGNAKFSKHWYIKFVYREDAIRSFASLKTDNSKWIEWAKNIDEEDSAFGDDSTSNNGSEEGNTKSIDQKSIFVGQISNDISKEDLMERFSKHGDIEELVLTKRFMNNFAFIKYKDESSCATAVEKENHSMFKDKTLHVQYKEIHNNPNRNYKNRISSRGNDFSKKVFGIELAPPPINLVRKKVNGPSYRHVGYNSDAEVKASQQYRSCNSQFQPRHNQALNSNEKYRPPNSFLPSSKWNHLIKSDNFPKVVHERGSYNRNFCTYKPRWTKQNEISPSHQHQQDSAHRTPPPSITSEASADKSLDTNSMDAKSEKGAEKADATGTTVTFGTTGTNDTTVGSIGNNPKLNGFGPDAKRMNTPFFYYIPSTELVANQMQGYMQPMPQHYNPYAYYSSYDIPPQEYISQSYQYYYPPMSHPSDSVDYLQ